VEVALVKTQKTDAEQWLDERYAKDPGLRDRVEQLIAEMELEEQLVALREARGISQAALARMISVSQPRIAQLESGRASNIELRTLLRYVTALGGSIKITVQKHAPGKVVGLRKRAATA
jgi:predicted XRE-type DNA-binding protein